MAIKWYLVYICVTSTNVADLCRVPDVIFNTKKACIEFRDEKSRSRIAGSCYRTEHACIPEDTK